MERRRPQPTLTASRCQRRERTVRLTIVVLIVALAWSPAYGQIPGPPEDREAVSAETAAFAFFSETTDWVFRPPFGALVALEFVAPGSSVYPMLQGCRGLGDCPVTIEVCEPVVLVTQTKKKTVIESGNWKAKIKGDLRNKTFSDRMECERAAEIEPTGVVGIFFNDQLSIVKVVPGSPADEAGIKPGRRIVRVDGQEIDTRQQAERVLRGLPGIEVEVVVMRSQVETAYKLVRRPWSEVFRSPASLLE